MVAVKGSAVIRSRSNGTTNHRTIGIQPFTNCPESGHDDQGDASKTRSGNKTASLNANRAERTQADRGKSE